MVSLPFSQAQLLQPVAGRQLFAKASTCEAAIGAVLSYVASEKSRWLFKHVSRYPGEPVVNMNIMRTHAPSIEQWRIINHELAILNHQITIIN